MTDFVMAFNIPKFESVCGYKKGIVLINYSFYGAGGRTRTGMPLLAVDFESTTSTNSITPAYKMPVKLIEKPVAFYRAYVLYNKIMK